MTEDQPFEVKVIVAIRTLMAVCVVLAVGLFAAIGFGVWGFVDASNAENSAHMLAVGASREATATHALALQVSAQTAANSRQATANCAVVSGLSHVESEFIQSDATDRKGALTATERQQTIAGFRKIIRASLLTRLVNEQNGLDHRTIHYWRTVLVPEARALVSAAHCG